MNAPTTSESAVATGVAGDRRPIGGAMIGHLASVRSAWRHRRRRDRFDSVAALLGLDGTWTVVPTEADTAVAIGADHVVKIALSDASARGLYAHRRMIGHLADHGVADLAPSIVDHGVVDGHPYLVETRCHGKPLPRSTDVAVVRRAAAAVDRLHRATTHDAVADHRLLDRLVGQPLRRIAEDSRVRVPAERLHELHSALVDAYAGASLRLATVHGDHWWANAVAVDGPESGSVRLVDWENGAPGALPELDHVHYLLALHDDGPAAARHLASEVVPGIGDWLAQRLGPPPADTSGWSANPDLSTAAVIVTAWVHHVAAGLERASRYRSGIRWIATQVTPLFAPEVAVTVRRSTGHREATAR